MRFYCRLYNSRLLFTQIMLKYQQIFSVKGGGCHGIFR